jgi:hypothetical protein
MYKVFDTYKHNNNTNNNNNNTNNIYKRIRKGVDLICRLRKQKGGGRRGGDKLMGELVIPDQDISHHKNL